MGGCTNCVEKPGCDDHKGDMMAAVESALARLYPDRVWGAPDDAARFENGVSVAKGRELARFLGVALKARTWFRRGAPDEYCNYIYVLCMGRQPCLGEIRDQGLPIPGEFEGQEHGLEDLYLRICLSDMVKMAGVQEVSMSLTRVGRRFAVVERTRGGVYQAPLLPRMQKLVTILPEHGIRHLDFGDISAPLEGFSAGEYQKLYGGRPCAANFLFYPQPISIDTTTLL
jgi:hypothetical protein